VTGPVSSVEPPIAVPFRRTIAHWATGVAIVTAHEDGKDFGLTVNSLTSITLDPPLLLISLGLAADTTPVIRRTGRFGVSILTAGQRPLSERFAKMLDQKTKFDGVAVHRGQTASPLLDGAMATLECTVEREIPIADHVLLVGRVVTAAEGSDAVPLLFFRSHYVEGEGPHLLRFDTRTGT
jgi:3-hydroxy-9,10-secoandrosta-1,3,5(10)-triene-9,17-dione monooxygenase reductase component